MKDRYIEIGNRIQLRRKELHMKQSELAEKVEISTNHMSSIETGQQKPSFDVFLCICEELKVTPDYILMGNMHANDIRQDIIDGLQLCTEEDVKLIRHMVEYMVNQNRSSWNRKNYT